MNVEYNRGASGVVYTNKQQPNIIAKKTKKTSIHQEYTIHTTCFDLCSQGQYKILKIPMVYELQNAKVYSMEKIDDRTMVTEPTGSLLIELNNFIDALKNKGIVAFDYELYEQPDGTVYMIDFDRFYSLP